MNKAILLGNLTKDPETKALPNGSSTTTFRIGTNRSWVDSNGEKKTDATFHRVVVFGKQAESCGVYLKKGRQVLVEGRIQNRQFAANDGTTRYVSEVVAQRVQFLGVPSKKEEPQLELPAE